jgi:cobalt-zinc-cadmium efflux system protein
VHVWNLASHVPALSAHVVIAGERSLHDAQLEGNRLRTAIGQRFGIDHTTFELECHGCED